MRMVMMTKGYWKFYGLYTKEVFRFLKVPIQTLITPLFTSFLYLLIFGITLGKVIQTTGPVSYFIFLLPGVILLSVIRSAYENAAGAIMISKYTNEFQDLITSPFSIHTIILAKSLASITRGIFISVMTLAVGYALYFSFSGSLIYFAHPIMFVFMCCIIGFIFSNIGVAFAILARTYDHISGFNMLILTPLIYLGGVFYDVANLPSFWKVVSLYNPIVYMMDALRYTFFNTCESSFMTSFLITVASFVLSYLLAWYSLVRTKNVN